MSEFVHLHVHSHFSLLDSTVKLNDLLKRCKELGMDAVAVTDHGNLFHCIELQYAAKGSGVRPIYGVEVNVVPNRHDSATALRPCHLVLLAETLDGYRNMVRLVSLASLRPLDKNGRAVVDHGDLREFSVGLIALSGDLGGEIPQALLRGKRDEADALCRTYVDIYGEGNFFLEVERHEGLPETLDMCEQLRDLGQRLNVPLVATNNVHYLKPGDHEAHAILMCIGMEKRVDRETLGKIPLQSLYLRDPAEMVELFEDIPEAIRNTRRIADRCHVKIPTGTNYLPRFEVPDGFDEPSYLRHLSHAGLAARQEEFALADKSVNQEEYRARLDFELDVITQMGFSGYFLIVQDFINWAKRKGIPVGPGRGSGAGSLVAYVLAITDLDPIPYGLLFERFLNPERVSMPDFDIDFCQNRRGEVIRYVADKYGQDNVGMIITYGQLKAKAVVRDVARVLGLSFADSDRLSKLIPDEVGILLSQAYAREARLREAVAESELNQFLYNIALALEGNNRNTGIHAAGVVISEKQLWEYVPVLRGADGELITQFAKSEVEQAGLVKFDFLGLKTLTVIDDAVRLVNRGKSPEKQLDFRRVSFNDPKVYETIKSGDTTGIFQMESSGFQRLMRQLKPDCFEDVVAAVALYRPGPLGSGMVEQFTDCKHGRRQVVYPHPSLEKILAETYGVIVYQEQVMQVAQVLAGYTLGGADLLRRAMGKKKIEEMEKQRATFVAGAAQNQVSGEKANEVFSLMEYFAGYGFNKSHSAAYAVLTFQTAYLKTHQPTEFYAALMSNDASSTEKVVRYIVDARARHIPVLPPDVNFSDHTFSVVEAAIRFGFSAIKGVGAGPIEAIIEARKEKRFSSLTDFCERVDSKRCNRRVIETLIKCGSLDSLFPGASEAASPSLSQVGRWRASLLGALDRAVERAQQNQRDRESGQASFFDLFGGGGVASGLSEPTDIFPADVKAWDSRTVLKYEKQLLGFYVSGHPLDQYRSEIHRFTDCSTATIDSQRNRAEIRMACVITARRERPAKNGDGRMAFLTLEDHWGELEGIVYPKTYNEVAAWIESDEPLLVQGTVRVDIDAEGDVQVRKVVIDRLMPLWQARTEAVSKALLRIDGEGFDAGRLEKLSTMVNEHPGSCKLTVLLRFGAADVELLLPPDVSISASDDMVARAIELFGDDAVVFS
jgi:DNA polymerase-3 subunit alpha